MPFGRRKNDGRTDWSTSESGSAPAPSSSGSDTLVEERPAKPEKRPKPPKAPKEPKAAKAPKEPKAAKAPKEPKPPKAPKAKAAKPSGGLMAEVLYEGPSRAQMEQEAAAELQAALATSYNLLKAEVPDAGSPDEAQRKIESQLGRAIPD
ncbi:MAG: hypothetical protein LC792_29590, partial [Actinobacteria bacterium]|nr:hypothetical protein [Actinomycetota bacterium]